MMMVMTRLDHQPVLAVVRRTVSRRLLIGRPAAVRVGATPLVVPIAWPRSPSPNVARVLSMARLASTVAAN